MENEWMDIVNYRNIAHLSTAIIVILSVFGVMYLFARMSTMVLSGYAYWFGFFACVFALIIAQIFYEIMKIAEQEWAGDSEEPEDKV
jgi:cell division protein FtsW (lipid II flippase)